ncbi:threonine aldolase [Sinomicrobium pectinilyticum]|uniref:Threonine aldolase n=1 Tax=Sinomicrobium pectinilyticum TaxID=1084421 RepID=A0A3N0ETS6_SINP1|nr:beta-eliminating lyase-related protein [Sinomicrobium pectinilyticum]RNL91325.1 threonine aldolase [Sinomicrobium pectinilyticum]
MKKTITDRRNFIKKCGLSTIPLVLPATAIQAIPFSVPRKSPENSGAPVNFTSDSLFLSPREYLDKLEEINRKHPIERDFYGNGGTMKLLEEKFAGITGKEKAIYLPTGTMANQTALKLLSGNNTKVIVPENSHIFRDEADAAQSVHGKRLVPVGRDRSYFLRQDLEEAVTYLEENEVFKSGLGAIAVEHPIRRADGTAIPIEAIKEISGYGRQNGYKLHLDGARIHIASAYTGISVAEYASHFDTVYISLYKYLNAAGGAILCGNSEIIDQVAHQIKIHGGTVYQNWQNTAMALHYLEGLEERWKEVVLSARDLVSGLNRIAGITISPVPEGTNIYHLKPDESISVKELANYLYHEHNIWLGSPGKDGIIKMAVNESLLRRETDDIVQAWKNGVKRSKI